jgi:hypothetical protein
MESESKQVAELKELVRRNIALTQETHQMVHAMRRSARWASILHWGWWLIVLATSGYFYFSYVQPYVERVQSAYEQTQAGIHQAQDWQTNMANFFKNIFGGK